jgi:dTDP-4-dehydrorhamnose reductase
VRALLEKEYWGLYNCVCGGQTSRVEVAQELLKILKKDKEIKITTVTSEYFKDVYFAARPASERLITKKLDLRGVNHMRDWRISLKEYIETYYSDYL